MLNILWTERPSLVTRRSFISFLFVRYVYTFCKYSRIVRRRFSAKNKDGVRGLQNVEKMHRERILKLSQWKGQRSIKTPIFREKEAYLRDSILHAVNM